MSEKNKLTEKQYIENGGIRCPVCGSDEISGTGINTDAGFVTQDVGCDKCGSTWTDEYELVGMTLDD